MDNQQSELSPLATYPARTPKKKNRLLGIIVLVIILLFLFFVAKNLFGSKKQVSDALPPTPTPTEFQFPTDTPEASSDVTPTGEATGTPAPTKSSVNPVDSSTGLDRSSVSVEVLNGSGEVGAASKMADLLKGLGYNVTSSGNADNFDFANTEIHVKSQDSKFASLVKSDISSSYTVGVADADLDATAAADIQVIVGKQ